MGTRFQPAYKYGASHFGSNFDSFDITTISTIEAHLLIRLSFLWSLGSTFAPDLAQTPRQDESKGSTESKPFEVD